MNLRLFSCALLFICAIPATAQLEDADAATQAKCAEYLKTPLPAEAALVTQPKKWPECDSTKLYSGIGIKVDYTAARKCAWAERLAQQTNIEPRYTVASVLGGSAMLTVLYANGEGVKQSIPLAIRFACEAGGAPKEIEFRIESLDSLRSVKAAGKRFDFCQDITSGFMEGFCAAYSSELADQERSHAVDRIASGFTPAQKAAFDVLVRAESAYAEAHGRGEIDLSGTARAMFQIDAADSLRDDFEAALKAFERGQYPHGDHASAVAADGELNQTYHKQLADAEAHKSGYGAVQPEGIRDAERVWVKYRDAWIAFATLRYPHVSADTWLALLTRDRVSVLDGSFCDMDAQEGPCAWQGDTWKPHPLP